VTTFEECAVKTILPVGDADELAAFLGGADSDNDVTHESLNPRLRSVLNCASVTRSIVEISGELDMAIDEVYAIGQHLQSWGLALFVPVLTYQSVLQVHTEAQVDAMGPAAKAFDACFLGTSSSSSSPYLRSANGSETGAQSTGQDAAPALTATMGMTDVAGSIHDTVKSDADLFAVADSTPHYNLACFLAAFDGRRKLVHALKLVPGPLQEHSLDIIVWLLRRKLLFVHEPRIQQQEEEQSLRMLAKFPLLPKT
jgi:hypothetical protein